MKRHSILALALAGLLSACGGGGDSAPPPPATACTAASFQVAADTTVTVGKAGGATVASLCGALTNVAWRQTQGPALTLISARTQAISFEPALAGAYGFSVDFRDPDGIPRSLSVTVNAELPTSPVGVLVRADQAVREGGKASVRAWPAAAAGGTITWTQVAGPAVALDASDPNRVLFTAPAVSVDTPHRAPRHPPARRRRDRQRRRPRAGREPRAGALRPVEHRPVRLQRHARVAHLSVPRGRTLRRGAGALHVRSEPAVLRRRREPVPAVDGCPSCTRPPAAPSRRSARSWIAWWCPTTGWARCSSSS